MNRRFLAGGLILLAVLALGFTEPTYAADGRHHYWGHGWGGHRGYSGHGWGGHHRHWGLGFRFALPPIPLPVPVPVPPLGLYPYSRPYYAPPYPYDDYEPRGSRDWIPGRWARYWNEECECWEREWVPGHWSYR